MTESFADLFNESLQKTNMQSGTILRGQVVAIEPGFVVINAGLKSEAVIPAEEFMNAQGELEISVGDNVDVALDTLEDGFGETRLSRERARRAETWRELETANQNSTTITGIITGKVKGGFTVEIKNIRAFLPGSLVDVRPVRDLSMLEGKPLEFKVIKIDAKRNNIVVSRKAVVEEENSHERSALLGSLQEGTEIKGIVKNLTDYGAFIDLGGIDGLLHITDMSWKRVKHPSEIVAVGDEIPVKILRFDRERNRVSLGLKQLGSDPWVDVTRRYPVSTRLRGKVTNITDYGCFVEIEDGIEGLVHVSEMDWTNKNIHPSKVVQVGDEVEVMVLDIDEERRRISLGVKQCQENPWQAFASRHQKGERITGKIKSITDFGVFIGLDGNIDGLVHLSDISWNQAGEVAIRNYKKGDDIETVILQIDAERERISLGIKQMADDPFSRYVEEFGKGTVVTGTVKAVDAKGAIIVLAEEVEGQLRVSEISRSRVDDATLVLKVSDEVEAKIINVDRKNRVVSLSIKAMEGMAGNEDRQIEEAGPNLTLGELLKDKMAAREASSKE